MAELTPVYEEKYEGYYDHAREELIELITGSQLCVLEIGCGSGTTGRRLRETGKARWVTGVELVSAQADKARAVLDEVLVGDFAALEPPWPAGKFDCVVAGDVLEHMVDPKLALHKIRKLLAGTGQLVTSIPNVRHWCVVRDLALKGEWRYQQDGVLDETHVRFFTRRSAQRLLEETGFGVLVRRPYFWGPRTRRFDKLTFGWLAEFLAQRWVFVARPTTQQRA
jgi:SAM-dependent methyltransferase